MLGIRWDGDRSRCRNRYGDVVEIGAGTEIDMGMGHGEGWG